MKRLLIPALVLATLFGLASCANRAFYHPDRADYGSPAQSGLPYQNVYFHSADGTRLHGWFVPAQGVADPKQAATIVHFHGNAQNLSLKTINKRYKIDFIKNYHLEQQA